MNPKNLNSVWNIFINEIEKPIEINKINLN